MLTQYQGKYNFNIFSKITLWNFLIYPREKLNF